MRSQLHVAATLSPGKENTVTSRTSGSVTAEVLEKWRSTNVTIYTIMSCSTISALDFATLNIKHFTLVKSSGGDTEKSALDLSSHEPETFLREVLSLSSAPLILCNKLLLRYQIGSWDSSVTTVTRPWTVMWNQCFSSLVSKPTIQSHQMGDSSLPYGTNGST